MGPAHSEPLLVSLAAELEAINGWATQQPDNWWDTAPPPTAVETNLPSTLGRRRGRVVSRL